MNIRATILRWLGYQPMDLKVVFPIKQVKMYQGKFDCKAILTCDRTLSNQEVASIRSEWVRLFGMEAVILHGGLHLDSVVDSTAQEQKDKETT